MKEPRSKSLNSNSSQLIEFADLHELFKKIFCIPANSAPVERVVSTSELFMQPHCAVLA